MNPSRLRRRRIEAAHRQRLDALAALAHAQMGKALLLQIEADVARVIAEDAVINRKPYIRAI